MAIAVGRLGRPTPTLPGGLDTPVLLLQWRSGEVSLACGRYRRLARGELEEIYDETADALRTRTDEYQTEIHLQRALRVGIRMRALRRIRDNGTHERIVDEAAEGFYEQAQRQAWTTQPEQALLAREDDFLIGEFISELTEQERRVFALTAEGQSWRAIATRLSIAENESRNLTRVVERKRERFITLYESGRLCGYRSRTIDELLSGQEDCELAVHQALAHLRHCSECQREHHITGHELRARFDRGALVFLPTPLLTHHLSLLERVAVVLQKPIRLFERLSTGNGTVREHAAEGVAGGAVAAKTAVTVGLIAITGAVIEVHHIVAPSHPVHHTSAPVATQTIRQPPADTMLPGTDTNPFQWSHTNLSNDRGSGLGHLVGGGEGPGHIVSGRSTGPGRLVGTRPAPGRLVANTWPVRTSARTASYSDRPPIKPVGQGTATTASAEAPGKVTPTPSPSPSRLGRVLGP